MTHTLKGLRAPLRLLPLLLLLAPSATAATAATDPAPLATEPLEIIATVPTYAALAREIGGELVAVTTLCRPGQDIHGVSATPALIERIRGADLLLYTGLDLELWLDPLLRSSGNLDLLPGNPRAIEMSAGAKLKDVPLSVDRSQGDVHAFGNPHVWTDPVVVRLMAEHVRAALVAALPEQADAISARHKAFHDRLTAALVDWLTRYAPLEGRRVVVYHQSWAYLLDRFGIVIEAALEPKPRVAPTASHLAEVIAAMKADGVRVILREPWQAPDAAEFVAEATGATVLELATHPDPAESGEDLLKHFEHELATLAQALGVEVPARP